MTAPTPDPTSGALQRIAAVLDNIAFQLETANLLAYEQSTKTAALQQIAKRLDIEPPEVVQP